MNIMANNNNNSGSIHFYKIVWQCTFFQKLLWTKITVKKSSSNLPPDLNMLIVSKKQKINIIVAGGSMYILS